MPTEVSTRTLKAGIFMQPTWPARPPSNLADFTCQNAFPTLKKHKKAGFFCKIRVILAQKAVRFSPILQERSFVFIDLLASVVKK
jgi:hypothetical protein